MPLLHVLYVQLEVWDLHYCLLIFVSPKAHHNKPDILPPASLNCGIILYAGTDAVSIGVTIDYYNLQDDESLEAYGELPQDYKLFLGSSTESQTFILPKYSQFDFFGSGTAKPFSIRVR